MPCCQNPASPADIPSSRFFRVNDAGTLYATMNQMQRNPSAQVTPTL